MSHPSDPITSGYYKGDHITHDSAEEDYLYAQLYNTFDSFNLFSIIFVV